MNGLFAFLTPCSEGVTVGSCPNSNYKISLDGIIGNIFVYDLTPKELLTPGNDGCTKCPFYMSLKDIEYFNRLALLELPKRGVLNSRQT